MQEAAGWGGKKLKGKDVKGEPIITLATQWGLAPQGQA